MKDIILHLIEAKNNFETIFKRKDLVMFRIIVIGLIMVLLAGCQAYDPDGQNNRRLKFEVEKIETGICHSVNTGIDNTAKFTKYHHQKICKDANLGAKHTINSIDYGAAVVKRHIIAAVDFFRLKRVHRIPVALNNSGSSFQRGSKCVRNR